MTERTRRETSIAGEFSEIDRLADFYVQDCADFSTVQNLN